MGYGYTTGFIALILAFWGLQTSVQRLTATQYDDPGYSNLVKLDLRLKLTEELYISSMNYM